MRSACNTSNDNLVRSRSAEAHLMSPRIHTTHRLTVQRAAQPPMSLVWNRAYVL